MNSETLREPFLFGRRFLERHGALIEAIPEGFESLLPQDLAKRLDVSDYVRIKEGGPSENKEEYTLTYGSPLLDRMVELSCAQVHLASCRLSFHYLKSQGFDRLVQDQFSFRKALCRVTSTAPIKTDYVAVACRYVARSDEQKEGLISFLFHFDTGALIPGGLDVSANAATESAPLPGSVKDTKKWDRLMNILSRVSSGWVAREIQDFRESMNRRLRRDAKNLAEYYETLKREMEASLGRAGLSDPLIQDRKQKIAMLPEELARKKDDLIQKYSVRVKVIPCALLFIRTPAVRVLCDVHIGREKRPISLTYNPLIKSLDPIVCEGCGSSTTVVSFCPRHHTLCAQCSSACPVCIS